VRIAFWITEEANALGIFNAYCFSTSFVLNAPDCLFCSTLLSIAVHIHSVFCVPCTVCDIVQQLSFRGNYSAVWVMVYLQYTCTEGAVCHVYHQVPHTRTCEKVFCGNVICYFREKFGKCLA